MGYQNWVENSGCSDIDECGLAPTAAYCGANAYWSRQMHDSGINVLAFDAQINQGGKICYLKGFPS